MARMRDRVFAGMGALLFLGSACALTIFVILNPGQDPSNASATTKESQSSCDISTPIADKAQSKPESVKLDTPLTSLVTTDLTPGTGAAAKNGDCLVMKYQGNLASDGSVFDENYDKIQGLQFTLGQGQVIQGWDQGLVGMKVGGTRRLEIPYSLGYGDSGNPPTIPAKADLVFIVTLEQIKK